MLNTEAFFCRGQLQAIEEHKIFAGRIDLIVFYTGDIRAAQFEKITEDQNILMQQL